MTGKPFQGQASYGKDRSGDFCSLLLLFLLLLLILIMSVMDGQGRGKRLGTQLVVKPCVS